jgi:hypothetical protein
MKKTGEIKLPKRKLKIVTEYYLKRKKVLNIDLDFEN